MSVTAVEPPEENPIYYVFPPFPEAPAGVTIVPFKDFKPIGILPLTGDDETERDGHMIPTVRLPVSHDKEGVTRKGKKKNRGKASRAPGVKIPWWEEWEGILSSKRSIFNPMSDRMDRMQELAAEFSSNIPFNPHLQSIYDHWRMYLGIIGRMLNPKQRSKLKDEEKDDFSDEDDGDNTEDPAPPTTDTSTNNTTARLYLETDEELEERMDNFFNDPETSTKIFLSSHFREKGLIWSESKLHDGPMLVNLFLTYAIKNNAFPEYERGINAALEVTVLAQTELPLVRSISSTLTKETWSNACISIWNKQYVINWGSAVDDEDSGYAPMQEEGGLVALEQIGLQSDPSNLHNSETPGVNVGTGTDSWGTQENSWGVDLDHIDASNIDTGGWGTAATGAGDTSNPWNTTEDNNDGNDWLGHLTPFFPLVGPSSFPLTHAPIRVEKSTRVITAISPPSDDRLDSQGALFAQLGILTLAPWSSIGTSSDTAVSAPEMYRDISEGQKVMELTIEVDPHDPQNDLVQVLIDPSNVEAFRVGMGLTGIWVQAIDTTVVAVKETEEAGGEAKLTPGKKKKKKSKNVDSGKAKGWWYAENVSQVIPSYWMETS